MRCVLGQPTHTLPFTSKQGKVSKSTSHLCAEQGTALILITLSCRVRTRLWQGFLAFESRTVVEENVVEWMSCTAERGAHGKVSQF